MEQILKEIKETENRIKTLREETDKAVSQIIAEGKSDAEQHEIKEKGAVAAESEKKISEYKKSAEKLRKKIIDHADDEKSILDKKVKKNKDKAVAKTIELFERNLNA